MIVEGNGFKYALENKLVKKLDLMIERCTRVNPKNDAVISNEGGEGCLAGDVIVSTKRSKASKNYTMKELYNHFNGNPDKTTQRVFDLTKPTLIKCYNGDRMIFHKMNNIISSGIKKVYLLTLEDNISIKATATHKFLDINKTWIKLKDLKIGQEILCEAPNSPRMEVWRKIISITPIGQEETYDIQCEKPYHNFIANGIIVHNSGKTNSSVAEAYYIKLKTERDVHLFFKLQPLIDFAKKTSNKIIIWDEPSLDSLTEDRLKEINKDLRRLLMTCRKKRHFFIINWVKFWKFEEYIQVDRCLGMVHMYSRKEIQPGRFFYIPKKNLEMLRNDYTQRKKRNYKLWKSFGGNFPDIMEENFDKMGFYVDNIPNATYKQYELQKDKAINSIGEESHKKSYNEKRLELELNTIRKRIACIKTIPRVKLAQALGINSGRLREWDNIPLEHTKLLGRAGFGGAEEPNIINTMVEQTEMSEKEVEEEEEDDDFVEGEPETDAKKPENDVTDKEL